MCFFFSSSSQLPGAVQGVPGGGVQHRPPPIGPLHPGRLQRQAPSHEPPHRRHQEVQGVPHQRLQRGESHFTTLFYSIANQFSCFYAQ